MVQPNKQSFEVDDLTRSSELRFLNAYLYGLQFFRRKNLTAYHLKVILAVELLQPSHKDGNYPGRAAIATHLKLREAEIKQELDDLVEMRFVHELVPRYGDCDNRTYKLGALGGSFMKKILNR